MAKMIFKGSSPEYLRDRFMGIRKTFSSGVKNSALLENVKFVENSSLRGAVRTSFQTNAGKLEAVIEVGKNASEIDIYHALNDIEKTKLVSPSSSSGESLSKGAASTRRVSRMSSFGSASATPAPASSPSAAPASSAAPVPAASPSAAPASSASPVPTPAATSSAETSGASPEVTPTASSPDAAAPAASPASPSPAAAVVDTRVPQKQEIEKVKNGGEYVVINDKLHVKKPIKNAFLDETFEEIRSIKDFALDLSSYISEDGSEESFYNSRLYNKTLKRMMKKSKHKQELGVASMLAKTLGVSLTQLEELFTKYKAGDKSLEQKFNRILGNEKAFASIMDGLDYVESIKQYNNAFGGEVLDNGRICKGCNKKSVKAAKKMMKKYQQFFKVSSKKSDNAKKYISEDGEVIKVPFFQRLANGRRSIPRMDFGEANYKYEPAIEVGTKTTSAVEMGDEKLQRQSLKISKPKKDDKKSKDKKTPQQAGPSK